LVTVVIPAYNAAAFVSQAIESVLAQSWPQLDVVVVDDASTDATADVVAPYVAKGLVRLIRHERNKGLSGARNTGIRQGRGSFVAFLDADDLWCADHLERAMGVFERHPQLDIVVFDFDVLDLDSGRRIGRWFDQRRSAVDALKLTSLGDQVQEVQGELLTALFTSCFIHMQAVVARREVFEAVRFDERLRRSEDLDWLARVGRVGRHRLALCPVVTGTYHRHGSSLTSETPVNYELITLTEWRLFREYLRWPDLTARQRTLLIEDLSKFGLELSYYARKRRDWQQAWAFWRKSLAYGVRGAHLSELIRLLPCALARLMPRMNPFDGADGAAKRAPVDH